MANYIGSSRARRPDEYYAIYLRRIESMSHLAVKMNVLALVEIQIGTGGESSNLCQSQRQEACHSNKDDVRASLPASSEYVWMA